MVLQVLSHPMAQLLNQPFYVYNSLFLSGNRPAESSFLQADNPISVAVVGVGVFGRNHARVYQELEQQGEPVRLARPRRRSGARVRLPRFRISRADADDAQRNPCGVGGSAHGASSGSGPRAHGSRGRRPHREAADRIAGRG